MEGKRGIFGRGGKRTGGSEGEGELFGRKEAEGEAMEGGGAVEADGGAVVGGGVAFVGGPVVLGVLDGEGAHDFVAVGFGEDGGGGDVAEAAVAFDKGFPGKVSVGIEFVTVDDDAQGADGQGVEGAVHGGYGGAQDVQAVDFLRGADAYAPGDGLALDNGAQGFSMGFGDLLGVVEPGMMEVIGENDGGGYDGARETSAAGFVAAGLAGAGLIGILHREKGLKGREQGSPPMGGPQDRQGGGNFGKRGSGRGKSQGEAEGAAALVLARLEVFPLALDFVVGGQFGVGLGVFEAGFDVVGDEVGEEEGVDPFVLIFGLDGDEEEVDDVGTAAKGFQQVPPAGREQASAAFLEGAGEGLDGYADGYKLVLGVDHDGDEIQVENPKVHIDVILDLAVGQGGVAVETVVSLIDQAEKGFAVLLLDFLAGSEFKYFQVIAGPDDLGHTGVFCGNLVGDGDGHLHPLGIRFESQAFKLTGIIGIVVDGGHRAEFLESFDQHPLVVHVGEAHRTYHRGHPPLAPPVAAGFEEGVDNLVVVDEIQEAEAEVFFSGALVDGGVDYAGDTPHGFTVAVGHEALTLAEVESRIDLRRKGIDIVMNQRRHEIRIAVIETDAEFCKFTQFTFCRLDSPDFNTHCNYAVIILYGSEGRRFPAEPAQDKGHESQEDNDGKVEPVVGVARKPHLQVLDVAVTAPGIFGQTAVHDLVEPRGGIVQRRKGLMENHTVVADILRGVRGSQVFLLVEPYVDKFQVMDILGEDNRLGADGIMDDMVLLDIGDGLGKLAHDFVEYFGGYLPRVDELAEGVAVDIVGDDAQPYAGDLLEVIDHHDIGMAEVIPDVELLLDHRAVLRLVAQFGLEGLEHHPLAIFLSGIYIIELLVPFGKMLYLGPFFGFVFRHYERGNFYRESPQRPRDWRKRSSRVLSK